MVLESIVDRLIEVCNISDDDASEVDLYENYIMPSADIVWNRLHPYSNDATPYEEFPNRWVNKVVAVAVYLYNKRGAEGEITHDENGIRRTYESADVPESLLRDIVPYCKTL